MVPFRPGEELSLPALARTQGFDSDVFTVVDVIRGGMGVCARVRQTPSGPSFALKALSRGAHSKEDFERFLAELQIWLTLSVCDGIVEALCVFPLEKMPVVCSRWMAGGSLRSQMPSRDPELFYRSIVRIAGALDWAAVEHHIVHRDLKPENILLDEVGRAAVSDWGISTPLGEGELESTPGGGRVIFGTAAYASPEQLLGGVPLDLRSDIYSLGCLMYEWETGQTPFQGSWHAIREAKIRGEPPRMASGLFRKTSFGAEDVIMRCLQRERHDRYPDWKAFVNILSMAAARRGITVTPFVPKMRYQASARGAGVLRARVAGGAVVTGRGVEGRASVDVRGAARDLDEAKKLAGKGNWKAAVELLSRIVLPSVVRELPDDPLQQTAVLTLARGLLELGRGAEAVTALDALSGAVEKPADLFIFMARAQLSLGQAALAERAARAGLGVHEGNPKLLECLLEAQRAQGLFSDAIATARQRLAVTRDAAALSTVAEQLVEHAARVSEARLPDGFSSLHEAVSLLSEARELAPHDPSWRLSLAHAFAALERWPEARVILEGITEAPDVHRAQEGAELLAKCLLSLREYAACLAQCNRSLALFPDSVALSRHRALAFAEGFVLGVETEGRRVVDDAAMSFFEKIIADAAHCEPVDFLTLARYREWTGRADEGVALLARGRKAFPESWEIATAQARHLERRGAFEDALAAAQEAVRLAPFRPESWSALAAIRGILGPKEEANDARRKAGQAEGRLRSLRTNPPETKKKA
ncbi:MAG TPA: protein kinase [Thermoanaerobaculia bacterium]|nr:protein kinase [Thermoanaerobaculia bacterium]